MNITETSDLWWKNAIIYCLDVETHLDWDGDGTGDMIGLGQRMDHLSSLGVTCLWLMPFNPSGGRDDGYDVVDFYGVDPQVGSLGDFVEVIRMARSYGMRVIVELVVNHTSDQHPWFQAGRASVDDPHHDFYLWRKDEPPDTSSQTVFPAEEDGIWSFNEPTGEYYLHHFYREEPELNVANPMVRYEIAKIMAFWLELGVSGFRVDSAPFIIGEIGETEAGVDLPEPHAQLKAMRAFLGRRTGDAVLLGEVDLDYATQMEYFGGPACDEMNLLFDFNLMQQTYLALARQDARPVARTLAERPIPGSECQWATFLRNHDEVTLDRLTESERQEVFEAFGPEEDMQIYGRGLRRRLPPMVDGDERRLQMAYSLLLTMPGTPVLLYGEEIGMGENLDVPGRFSVRTPMQWDSTFNGGFSTADADKLPRPFPETGYGPTHVNVDDQRDQPDSTLSFMTHVVHRRRACPEFGFGAVEVLPSGDDAVLVHRCTWDDSAVVAIHNFGPEATEVALDLPEAAGGELSDVLSPGSTGLDDAGHAVLQLDGFGYRWLRVKLPAVPNPQ